MILIPFIVLLALLASFAFRSSAVTETDFDSLPAVYVATTSRGTGDGSSPENAMGNAADYQSGYPTGSDGKLIPQLGKTALYRGYSALKNTGGTLVVCDELVLNWSNAKRTGTPSEYYFGEESNANSYRITSVYGGTDFRDTGAKLVLDSTDNPSLGIRFNNTVLIDNITIDYKYKDGNEWYGANKKVNTENTVLLAFLGKSSVIGEGVKVNSVPSSGAEAGCLPSLIAGDRYRSLSSTDLTVKSGSWYMVIAGSHGMTKDYPGNVTNAKLTVTGGRIKYVIGEGGLDTPHGIYSYSEYVDITIGEGAKVDYADGSPANYAAANKKITYDVNALKYGNVKSFISITPTGELKEEEDDFDTLPAVFIASAPRGRGDGSSPENAMGNAADYDDLLADADRRKSAYLKNALRLGFDSLKSTGGTVVVCGELTVDCADAFRSTPAEFNVQAAKTDLPFKLTSVYDGIDYAEKSGAKLILDQDACQSLNLIFRSRVTIENLTIDYVHSSGNDWYKNEKATMFIMFDGMKSVVGEGVTVNSIPVNGGYSGRYPTLIAGHRYADEDSTDLTVKSGTWDAVIAGSHGMGQGHPAHVLGDAKLTVLGGTVYNLYGESSAHPTYAAYTEVIGKTVVVIGKGANVRSADGSPVGERSSNKSITYDLTSINKYAIRNFENVTRTGEGEDHVFIDPDMYEYSLNDGDATITKLKHRSDVAALTVPEKINGYTVVKIGDNAFESCWSLTSVTLPKTVREIGEYAFTECHSLSEVILPSGLMNIGYNAFYSCYSLKNVTIPDSVTTIGSSAFAGCTNLENVTIPDSVTEIGQGAFARCVSLKEVSLPYSVKKISNSMYSGCWGLTEVRIPDTVNSIGEYAFGNCTGITSVTIPRSVNSISSTAFSECPSLSNITVEQGNSSYHSAGNCLIATASKRLVLGCKNSVIPNDGSVTSIGDNAFYQASALTQIDLPENLTSIGESAFYYCTGLKEIVLPETLKSIGNSAFANCSGIKSLVIPESVLTLGGSAFCYCTALTEVVLPENLTEIGHGLFFQCTALEEIDIPSGVTAIGYGAFEGCSKLAHVKLPKGLTLIENNAFSGCGSLTEITVPDGVKQIGQYAFSNCGNLQTITIPQSVTSIHWSAFSGSDKLVIRGIKGSYAETFAQNRGIPFEKLPLYGDADDDGTVSALDVVRLKRYFAEYDHTTEKSTVTIAPGADANGDGRITALDVVRLKKYLASRDSETGNSPVPLGKWE